MFGYIYSLYDYFRTTPEKPSVKAEDPVILLPILKKNISFELISLSTPINENDLYDESESDVYESDFEAEETTVQTPLSKPANIPIFYRQRVDSDADIDYFIDVEKNEGNTIVGQMVTTMNFFELMLYLYPDECNIADVNFYNIFIQKCRDHLWQDYKLQLTEWDENSYIIGLFTATMPWQTQITYETQLTYFSQRIQAITNDDFKSIFINTQSYYKTNKEWEEMGVAIRDWL